MPRLSPGLCPALTKEAVDKIQALGITNVFEFLLWNMEALAKESRVSYKDLASIRRVLQAKYAAIPVSGEDLLNEKIESTTIITSGNESLDKILGGGLVTGEVTEIYGSWGVGKSHLCLSLAVHNALRFKRRVLYIDPMAAVSAERTTSLVESLTSDMEEITGALSRIEVVMPVDIWALISILEGMRLSVQKSASLMSSQDDASGGDSKTNKLNNTPVSLIIIDSLTSLLTPLMPGSQIHGPGVINQLAGLLKEVAKERQCAVLVINFAVQGDQSAPGESHLKPALGRYWAHVPHTRLFLELSSDSTQDEKMSHHERKMDVHVTVEKSCRLPLVKRERISLFPFFTMSSSQ